MSALLVQAQDGLSDIVKGHGERGGIAFDPPHWTHACKCSLPRIILTPIKIFIEGLHIVHCYLSLFSEPNKHLVIVDKKLS